MEGNRKFFQEHKQYFWLNGLFFFLIGQWPIKYHNLSNICFATTLILTEIIIVPQVIAIFVSQENVDTFLNSFPSIIVEFSCMVKLICNHYNKDKVKKLLSLIVEDWISIKSLEENKILHEITKNGRQLSICYGVFIYGVTVSFALLPLLTFLPVETTNKTNKIEAIVPFEVDYRVDSKKIYYYILPHIYTSVIAHASIVISYGVTFIVMISHTCAMFSILGKRLKNLIKSTNLNINVYPELKEDKVYEKLRDCILEHNRIIIFLKLMESIYCVIFFFDLFCIVSLMGSTMIQILMHFDEPAEFLRQGGFFLGIFCHLLFLCWQTQKVMNYYVYFRNCICDIQWYCASLRSRKLIHIMLLRTMREPRLTAGKIFIFSLESLSSVVRTAMSFLAVLQTMQ